MSALARWRIMCLSAYWQWKLANERARISAVIVKYKINLPFGSASNWYLEGHGCHSRWVAINSTWGRPWSFSLSTTFNQVTTLLITSNCLQGWSISTFLNWHTLGIFWGSLGYVLGHAANNQIKMDLVQNDFVLSGPALHTPTLYPRMPPGPRSGPSFGRIGRWSLENGSVLTTKDIVQIDWTTPMFFIESTKF